MENIKSRTSVKRSKVALKYEENLKETAKQLSEVIDGLIVKRDALAEIVKQEQNVLARHSMTEFKNLRETNELIKKFIKQYQFAHILGMDHFYANVEDGGDIHAYEVIKFKDIKRMTIRRLKVELLSTELLEDALDMNTMIDCEDQKWSYEVDENGETLDIILKGQWMTKDGRKVQLSDEPREFYDFNEI